MRAWLRLAAYMYGTDAVDRVFEPLVADAHEEIGRSRAGVWTRLRWQVAMAGALVAYAPRLLATPLLLDLVVRALAFGAIAFALQLLFALFGRRGVPATFASTLPFVVLPLVWRVRVSTLPYAQRRFLAIAIGIASTIAIVASADGSWPMRLAIATMPVLVASWGWRSGDSAYEAESAVSDSIWIRGVLIGSAFQVATWIPLLVSGQNIFGTYWPGRLILLYLVGTAISASMIKRWHVQGA